MGSRKQSDADLESKFQAHLKKRLAEMFPGCWIFKQDSAQLQGVPDLLILYRNMWAMLEVKAYEGADEQPNQGYYVEHFDNLSFAAFIYPENEEEVLHDLQQALLPAWRTRVPQRV